MRSVPRVRSAFASVAVGQILRTVRRFGGQVGGWHSLIGGRRWGWNIEIAVNTCYNHRDYRIRIDKKPAWLYYPIGLLESHSIYTNIFCVFVCVCVWEREERERDRQTGTDRQGEPTRGWVKEILCVCVRERERERERERVRVCIKYRSMDDISLKFIVSRKML